MTDTTSDAEFTIERHLAAPRALVWKLWTDPTEMSRWYHPAGFTTPVETVEVDLRVGGHYRYTMIDGDSGEQYPTGGEYVEIREPERLVFTWGDPADPFSTATVVLDEVDDGTLLRFTLRGAVGQPGDDSFYDGWSQALDELEVAASGASA
jgi:uncharacterized protein YndB with AHSA1/START domain